MKNIFMKILEEKFKFLITEYHFCLKRCEVFSGGCDVLYANNICAVRVLYEFKEAYLFITLYELQHGKWIDNPRPITKESILTGYSLDDILSLRAPDAQIKPAYAYGINSEYYDKENGLALYVSKFSENLKKYASDVLLGDFSVFKLLDPVVKNRCAL